MMSEFDVVVVGGGAAGVACAIEASEHGASVLVVEKLPYLGGTAMVSGGGCIAVGTKIQESIGAMDTLDVAVRDWLAAGGPEDEPWARYYLAHSLRDMFLWAEELGVPWERLTPPEEGNTVPRRHYPKGGGLALMEALVASARTRSGIEFRTSTGCSGPVVVEETEGRRRVVGIRENSGRGAREIRAGSVVLTTGGFCSNLDLIREFAPRLAGYRVMEGSGEGANGSGHIMLKQVGAAFSAHLGEMTIYCYATPDYRDPADRRGLVIRRIHGNIWVNSRGERFHNEVDYGLQGTRAYLAQDPPTVWSILDSEMIRGAEVVDPYYRRGDDVFLDRVLELFERSPDIKSDPHTIEGLAKRIGVDPTKLSGTVATYNGCFESGLERDPLFGKPLRGLRPIQRPPFYAIRFYPLARKSLGGVLTSMRCQVLGGDREPIPGLYAAGELASPGGCHIGYLGHTLGQCILSGRIAGASAAGGGAAMSLPP